MKENDLSNKFQIEELEQRFEMGWSLSKVEASVNTDAGTLTFDSSKL